MKQLTLPVILLLSITFASAKKSSPKPSIFTTSLSKIKSLPGKDFDFTVIALQTGMLTLKVKMSKEDNAYIYFEDKSGIPVSSKRIKLQDSEDIVYVDISDLPNNSYRLTMASGAKRISKTILIPK
jgi:hypothetical protein